MHLQQSLFFLQQMAKRSQRNTDNVDVACRVWADLFLSTTLPYIPLLHVITRPKNKPWMTAHLHKLTRQKNRLFRAALRSGASDSSAWSAYKKHKNLCNEQFRRAKNAYLSTLHTNLANESNGSHRWWTKAKSLAKISTPRREVPDLKDPTTGELVTTDFAKANILGSYFSEQCTNPMPEHNCVGAPFPLPQHHPSFTFPEISELSVFRQLQRLSPFRVNWRYVHHESTTKGNSPRYLDFSGVPLQSVTQNNSIPITVEMCQGHTNLQKPRRSIQPIKLPSCIVVQCHWQSIRCPTKPISIGVFTIRNHLLSDHQ